MNEIIKEIIPILGTGAVIIAAVTWLAKQVISQFLSRDIESYKNRVQRESEKEIENLRAELRKTAYEHETKFSELHKKRADVIFRMHENLIHILSWCQTLPLKDQIKKETSEQAVQNLYKLLYDGKKYYEIHQIYLPGALAIEMDGAFTEIFQLVERFDSKIKLGGHVDEQGQRETFERIEGIISPIRDNLQKQFRTLLGVTLEGSVNQP